MRLHLLGFVLLGVFAHLALAAAPPTQPTANWPTRLRLRMGMPLNQRLMNVDRLAFSSDGQHLATSDGTTLMLWDVPAWKLRRTWDFDQGLKIRSFEASTLLATGVRGSYLLDLATGKHRLVSDESRDFMVPVAMKARLFGSLTHDGRLNLRVDLRHLDSNKLIRQMPLPLTSDRDDWLESLALSPDGLLLISSHCDNLRVWDTRTGRKIATLKQGHGRSINPTFSPDGGLLACSSLQELTIWETKTWNAIASLKSPRLRWDVLSFAFSPDSATLSVTGATTVRTWDRKRGFQNWPTITPEILATAFSPDGKWLATSDATTVRVWDAATRREAFSYPADPGHLLPVTSLRYLKRGTGLLSSESGRVKWMWDLRSARPLQRLTFPPVVDVLGDGDLLGMIKSETDTLELTDLAGRRVAVLEDTERGWPSPGPDGRVLVYYHSSSKVKRGQLRLFDLSTRKKLWYVSVPLEEPAPEIGSFRFSPDGLLLAALSGRHSDSPISLWDAATGQSRPCQSRGGAFVFSRDSRLLLSAGLLENDARKPVMIRDPWANRSLGESPRPAPQVRGLALSPDDRLLAAGTEAGHIVLWDLLTEREVARLKDHTGPVFALAFSPDGSELASGGQDTMVRVWNVVGIHHRLYAPSAAADQGRLDRWWAEMTRGNAWQAHRARWHLACVPEQAIPLVRKHLAPVKPLDRARVAQLIVDLDSEEFTVRERATAKLSDLADLVGPALRAARAAKPPLEQALRLDRLIRRLDGVRLPAWQQHGVMLLQTCDTAESRRLLRELADGAEGALLTVAAKAALKHLREP